MKMRLISGDVVEGLPADIAERDVKESIDVDLSKRSMEVVDVLFQRHPITQNIETSLMILNDGIQIRVVGDIRDHTDIVVREMNYNL